MGRTIDLQGHRGARGLFPENTLAGFQGALSIGVNTLELDVRLTADGIVVVTHDARLNPDITRTADGRWLKEPGPLVSSLRLADLQAYDVGRIRPGSDYATQYPDQAPQDGASIPTFAEVVALDPTVTFNVELKSSPGCADGERLADAVLAVADQLGATHRIIIQSFDWRGPRRVKRMRADVRFAWLTRSEIMDEARRWWDGPHPSDFGGSVPRAVAAEGGAMWTPLHSDLTKDDLEEAHGLGLVVVPWTVNQPDDMRRLLVWGIDGLITDRPDLARTVLAEQGFSLPVPRSSRPEAQGSSLSR